MLDVFEPKAALCSLLETTLQWTKLEDSIEEVQMEQELPVRSVLLMPDERRDDSDELSMGKEEVWVERQVIVVQALGQLQCLNNDNCCGYRRCRPSCKSC